MAMQKIDSDEGNVNGNVSGNADCVSFVSTRKVNEKDNKMQFLSLIGMLISLVLFLVLMMPGESIRAAATATTTATATANYSTGTAADHHHPMAFVVGTMYRALFDTENESERDDDDDDSNVPPRNGFMIHRRLNQERQSDGSTRGKESESKHVSSYAQRHPGRNSYYYGSNSQTDSSLYSSSYYNYEDDDSANGHRRYNNHNYNTNRERFFHTNISDVWLCLLTALGWAVWMISSFRASSENRRFRAGPNAYFVGRLCHDDDADDDCDDNKCEGGTNELYDAIEAGESSKTGTASQTAAAAAAATRTTKPPMANARRRRRRFYDESVLLVRGNVRDVILSDFDDGGIPTYTAIVDYMIEQKQTHETIQIRKHFDTQQQLEQGFANVELLVLPDEPTHSVLKEDFDQQVQEEMMAEKLEQERQMRLKARLSKVNNDDDKNNSSLTLTTATATTKGPSDQDSNSTLVGDVLDGRYCQWKRVSTCFAALLVVASLAGTVQVVCLLEAEQRWLGWLSFCVGVALLLPFAVGIQKAMVVCNAWQEQPEKQGYIVQSYTLTEKNAINAGGCCKGPSTTQDDVGSTSTSLRQASMPPSSSSNWKDCNCCFCDDTTTTAAAYADKDVGNRTSYAEVASYIVPEMSGCYFVHYPTNNNKQTNGGGNGIGRSIARQQLHRYGPVANRTSVQRTIPEENLPNNLNEECDEIVSTSSVSSMSDQDPLEPAAAGRRRRYNEC